MSNTVIGIDLGTTYSACGIYKNGKSTLIPNRLNQLLTPSVISIKDGKLLIGASAKQRLISHPEYTIATFKRHIGSDWKCKLGSSIFTATELSSFVLKSLREDAEVYLGKPISKAVISVPAYFNNTQREATIQAGILAGLEVEGIINEPTAAAMSYGLHEKPDEYTFIVLDLGGGTFDISVMEYYDQILEVQSTAGDNHLGGEDFTEALIGLYLEKNHLTSKDLKAQEVELVYTHMERAKKELSSKGSIRIDPLDPVKGHTTISYQEFKESIQPLLDRVKSTITRAILDAKVDVGSLDAMLFVGGSSRLECFRELSMKFFRKIPLATMNPDLAIASGATIQAALKAKKQELSDVVLTDVSPYSFGVDVHNINHSTESLFDPIIERNTVVPVSRISHYEPVHKLQPELLLKIYQGEHRLVSQNHYLGEIAIKLPMRLKNKPVIEVRFSYDSNGILEIDAKVLDTGKSYNKLIISDSRNLSQKEIEETLRRLEKYKQHPRENERNVEIVAMADKLFTITKEPMRGDIQENTILFESILATQDRKKIQKAYREFSEYLSNIQVELHIES